MKHITDCGKSIGEQVKHKISIIGSGNGGQTIAGHLSLLGHDILLFNRSINNILSVYRDKKICLKGQIEGVASIKSVTDDIGEAVDFGDVIMIVTTADAHGELAKKMVPYLRDNQIVILNPGRTGGAFEFRQVMRKENCTKRIFVIECQTLLYACRQEGSGVVRVAGMKDAVYYATLPASDLPEIRSFVFDICDRMVPVENVLITSLGNVGVIFHPSMVIFNALSIDGHKPFYFYRGITPTVSRFLESLDDERLSIGKAYGVCLKSVYEWMCFAYRDVPGNNLLDKIRLNPAYRDMMGPNQLDDRFLVEEVRTGIVPMRDLGRVAGLELPLMTAIEETSNVLAGRNFRREGRTLASMGLESMTVTDILGAL